MEQFLIRRLIRRSTTAEQFIMISAETEEEALEIANDDSLDEELIVEENEFPDMIFDEIESVEMADEFEVERFASGEDANESLDDLDDDFMDDWGDDDTIDSDFDDWSTIDEMDAEYPDELTFDDEDKEDEAFV